MESTPPVKASRSAVDASGVRVDVLVAPRRIARVRSLSALFSAATAGAIVIFARRFLNERWLPELI